MHQERKKFIYVIKSSTNENRCINVKSCSGDENFPRHVRMNIPEKRQFYTAHAVNCDFLPYRGLMYSIYFPLTNIWSLHWEEIVLSNTLSMLFPLWLFKYWNHILSQYEKWIQMEFKDLAGKWNFTPRYSIEKKLSLKMFINVCTDWVNKITSRMVCKGGRRLTTFECSIKKACP